MTSTEMRERATAALDTAGSAGLSTRELAHAIGVEPAWLPLPMAQMYPRVGTQRADGRWIAHSVALEDKLNPEEGR